MPQRTGVEDAAPAALRQPLGAAIHALASDLYPICRSLAGPGVRQTLDRLEQEVDLRRTEVATGTPVLDWTVPREWDLRSAWIRGPDGECVLDAAESNLHVLNYSAAIHIRVSLDELKQHVFTLPDQPDLIPYRTSYHVERWGFCMRHRDLDRLPEGEYEVCIDAEHRDGHMSYGEHVLPGASEREFLLSAHICHPSLANDNCSGLAVLAHVAKALAGQKLRHTYRFLFAPGSIGAITWLSRNGETTARIAHGLVVSCLGDGGGPVYKRSRRGTAPIDRAMEEVLRHAGPTARIVDFEPYGYDERQYCSPGYDLPVGCLQRSAWGSFPEYHTSADNLDFIRPEHLAASHDLILQVIEIVEQDWVPLNLSPHGEPQLGRRGLYGSIGGVAGGDDTMALLWVLNLADGDHSILDMAERSGLRFHTLATASRRLLDAGLLADTAGTPAHIGSNPPRRTQAG